LRKGLPRGGLGQVGWIVALGALAVAWIVRADVALLVGLLALLLCVWCALGLRKDDQAGEVSDFYVDDESVSWRELLAGNWEHPVRRRSNGMIFLGVLGCAIAWCRWHFGWGPFSL
jgi:hypothetical protein